MPVVAVAVRGITPVEPLPSRRPAAAAVSGTTPVGADPARRPGAAVEAVAHCVLRTGSGRTTGGGRVRIHWSGMGRLCDVADEDAGGRHEPGLVGGCSGSPGVRGGPRRVVRGAPRVCYASFRLLRSFTLCCASSSRTVEVQEA